MDMKQHIKEKQEMNTYDLLRYELMEKEKEYLKAQILMELFLTRNYKKKELSVDKIYEDRYEKNK